MKLVKVVWRDTVANDDGWSNRDELIDWAKSRNAASMETVGYLVYQDEELVIVAATIDRFASLFNDVSEIPRGMVVRIEPLKPG